MFPTLQDIYVLIPGTFECYLIWQKGVFADVIKVRLLRWEDHGGLSGWALNAITCPYKREGKGDPKR